MSGYSLILQIRRLEEECDKLGFMMCHSKHGHHREFGDVVAIKPKDAGSLPIFSRDSELFVGTINELSKWLEGVKWARNYDRMLFGKGNDAKRERKEQDWRNKQLINILKSTDVNDNEDK
jgi:hypothetical protein